MLAATRRSTTAVGSSVLTGSIGRTRNQTSQTPSLPRYFVFLVTSFPCRTCSQEFSNIDVNTFQSWPSTAFPCRAWLEQKQAETLQLIEEWSVCAPYLLALCLRFFCRACDQLGSSRGGAVDTFTSEDQADDFVWPHAFAGRSCSGLLA